MNCKQAFFLKQASTAFIRKLRVGKLSSDALHLLESRGVAKDARKLANGINRGSMKLMEKHAPEWTHERAKTTHRVDPNQDVEKALETYSGPKFSATPNTKIITGPKSSQSDTELDLLSRAFNPGKTPHPLQNRLNHAIARRHEVYEALESKRTPNQVTSFVDVAGGETGKHVNLGVIGRESNLVASLPNSYSRKAMVETRKYSGESSTDAWKGATSKSYATHLPSKDINRMRHSLGAAVPGAQTLHISDGKGRVKLIPTHQYQKV